MKEIEREVDYVILHSEQVDDEKVGDLVLAIGGLFLSRRVDVMALSAEIMTGTTTGAAFWVGEEAGEVRGGIAGGDAGAKRGGVAPPVRPGG